MAARHRATKKASGGLIKGVPVPGADLIREAQSDNEGFKKGGKVGKVGMEAKGGKSRFRADKPGRKFARGGSVYSAAHKGGKSAPVKGAE